MTKSWDERYYETNQKSTPEISANIRDRKSKDLDTGVAERVYEDRTGHPWQEPEEFGVDLGIEDDEEGK